MEKLKRAVHFDFHTCPGIDDMACDFDAQKFAKTLKNANVGIINATAMCNMGFAYYPTKVGVKYPGLEIDLFGEIVKACRKEGIRVIGYVSTGLSHEVYNRHPEWCRINADGQIISGDRTGNFFRTQCFNTPHTDYMLSILKEVLEYDICGLFLDNVITYPCYCPTCTRLMLEEGIDINDPKAVYDFSYRSTREFAKKVRALIPKDKYVYTNGFDEPFAKTHGEVECLPCGGWGYDKFSSVTAYVRNQYEQTTYMTGRFQCSWGDFGGYRSRASLENDFFDALTHNSQVSVGDHFNPKGALDTELYDMIGDIYAKIKAYEPWIDPAHYIKEVAVLRNFTDEYRRTYDAAARMLGELKYNFDVIDESMDFSPYNLIIIPDKTRMTEKIKNKLEEYMADERHAVLSAGESLLDRELNFVPGKYWDFVEFCGIDDTKTSYFKYPDKERIYAMYNTGTFIKTAEENVVAKYVKPYFTKHWDGKHGYFYTPPKCETEFAAVAQRGRWRHISFDIFEAYYNSGYKAHRDIVEKFMREAIAEPLIDAGELPSTARATLTGTDDYNLLHVKVTYPEVRGLVDVIEEHGVLPSGRKVRIYGK